jgi:hypothetical protein
VNSREPLGLPRGSVRAILAILLVGTVCALAIAGRIDEAAFMGLAGVALYAYFENRRRPGA